MQPGPHQQPGPYQEPGWHQQPGSYSGPYPNAVPPGWPPLVPSAARRPATVTAAFWAYIAGMVNSAAMTLALLTSSEWNSFLASLPGRGTRGQQFADNLQRIVLTTSVVGGLIGLGVALLFSGTYLVVR